MEMRELELLGRLSRLAERTRLGPDARRRVLSEIPRAARRSVAPPAWVLAAAALLILMAAPSALVTRLTVSTDSSQFVPTRQGLNLQARLAAGGAVVLEWENGSSVHTVRRATSAAGLARVAGVRVVGGQFLDASPGGADVVYYQVD